MVELLVLFKLANYGEKREMMLAISGTVDISTKLLLGSLWHSSWLLKFFLKFLEALGTVFLHETKGKL